MAYCASWKRIKKSFNLKWKRNQDRLPPSEADLSNDEISSEGISFTKVFIYNFTFRAALKEFFVFYARDILCINHNLTLAYNIYLYNHEAK